MQNVIDFVTDDGVTISIEAAPVRRAGASGVSRDVFPPGKNRNFDVLVSKIQKIAEAVSGQLDRLSHSKAKPTETRIEFGVSVSMEADVLVARGNGESSFKVTLVWKDGS